MVHMRKKADVVFMDPPRRADAGIHKRGSHLNARSCGPDNLRGTWRCLRGKGYEVKGAWGVDTFPGHCEVCVRLERK